MVAIALVSESIISLFLFLKIEQVGKSEYDLYIKDIIVLIYIKLFE